MNVRQVFARIIALLITYLLHLTVAIIQKQLSCHRKFNVAFTDLRKAFDSVVQEKVMEYLAKKWCEWENAPCSHYLGAVTSMYNVVAAEVRARGDLTDSVMRQSGLKQGDVYSPVLFSLFTNELAKETVLRGR